MMEDLDKIKYFLKELTVIRKKCEERDSRKDQFNVFEAMFDKTYDEKNVHSRFIWSLLNYRFNNRQPYLDVFLNVVESKFGNEDSKSFNVYKECDDIDILLFDDKAKKAVIIENKIYAEDSNHKEEGQLEKYYRIVVEKYKIPTESVDVYYLTLDGHEPSEESVSTCKKYPELQNKVQCISYKYHITNWLKKCMQFAYDKPFQRETILQYLKLINTMTKNVDDEDLIDIIKLIGDSNDNLKSAKMLIDNTKGIHKRIIADFWVDLADKLGNKYNVVQKPKNEDFNNIAFGSNVKKNKTVLLIEIKVNEEFLIEINEDVNTWFNFGVLKNKKISKEYVEAFEKMLDNDSFEKDDNYYIRKYPFPQEPNECFNFYELDNEITFRLINDNNRKEIVNKIVSEIDKFINAVEKNAKRIRQK